jgi:hypothetical protein
MEAVTHACNDPRSTRLCLPLFYPESIYFAAPNQYWTLVQEILVYTTCYILLLFFIFLSYYDIVEWSTIIY